MKISRDKIRQQALLTGRRTLELGKEAGGRVRRFSRRTWIILGGAAVVAAGGLWWWLRPEPAKPVWPVVEVEPVQNFTANTSDASAPNSSSKSAPASRASSKR